MLKLKPYSLLQTTSMSALIAMMPQVATAQNITLNGQNATLANGCALPDTPANCATEVITPIDPAAPNPTSPWNLPTAYNTGIIFGTNLTKNPGGPAATGGVSVTDGAQVQSAYVYLGFEQNTEGNLLLSGPGTRWDSDSAAVVGKDGKGTFSIEDGAYYQQHNIDHFFIGYSPESEGLVVVDGVDVGGNQSTLDVRNRVYVGDLGHGEIRVLNGGLVSGGYSTMVAYQAGSTGLVVIDGVDVASGERSRYTTDHNNMEIGVGGTGVVNITNGGLLDPPLLITLGNTTGSAGYLNIDGINAVTGDRSALETGVIYAGYGGVGELNISNGAMAVASNVARVGYFLGSEGTINVDGFDAATGQQSLLESSTIHLGARGTGQLNVINGAQVRNTDSMIIGGIRYATDTTSDPLAGVGVLNVIGVNSVVESGNTISVGGYGQGILNLVDGATVHAPSVNLAIENSSSGTLNIGVGGAAGRLDATVVRGWAGQAEVNFNHTDTIDFAPQLTGALQVNHINSGQTTLVANNDYSGDTRVLAGTLAAGAVNSFSTNSDFQIGSTGTVLLGGYAQQLQSLDNAGTVNFGGQGGATLTVAGDYVGNGGLIRLNAALGNDGSITDQLVVDGNTSGTSNIEVKNVNGMGDQTTEGIQIVRIQGVSNGTFDLVGDYTLNGKGAVVAGAYAYQLYQGNQSGTDAKNWFLRSELYSAPIDPNKPLYNAGVPVYETYPSFLLGLNALPSWQQRVSNRYWNNTAHHPQAVTSGAPSMQDNGVWARLEGQHLKVSPHSSTSNSDYKFNSYKMQFGVDRLLNTDKPGQLVAGVNAQYTQGKAHIYSEHGNGHIKTAGYGLGATLTWYGDNDVYIDNQAQLTWYDSDLHSSTANRKLIDNNRGLGYALSTEIGKRIAIDDKLSITPQAQLSYSNARFRGFQDAFGTDVSKSKADSLQLRVGASLNHQHSWTEGAGKMHRRALYATAFLTNEFLGRSHVNVADVAMIQKPERLWVGVGMGGTYNWNNDKYAVYGELSLKSSMNHFGDSYGYRGIVGVKVRW